MSPRKVHMHLYSNGNPCKNFNKLILEWLRKSVLVVEHQPPASFESLRIAYDEACEAMLQITGDSIKNRWNTHRDVLSNVTKLMFGIDIRSELASRLTASPINTGGFRSALAQGAAKNTGENFINVIAYGLADALSFQDEVLVDKGLPPILRESLKLKKTFSDVKGKTRELEIPIEGDLCIFSRSNPLDAIVVNAKTRLKEVFHIGTMWKLFFDMVDDQYCLDKWGLEKVVKFETKVTEKMQYVFATADMISPEGVNSQGPDVEREEVRNLIAVDSSFFDYVFVSKQGIPHVSNVLTFGGNREALFHELGCLLDLISQKYNLSLD
jgi:hypothetical protein